MHFNAKPTCSSTGSSSVGTPGTRGKNTCSRDSQRLTRGGPRCFRRAVVDMMVCMQMPHDMSAGCRSGSAHRLQPGAGHRILCALEPLLQCRRLRMSTLPQLIVLTTHWKCQDLL